MTLVLTCAYRPTTELIRNYSSILDKDDSQGSYPRGLESQKSQKKESTDQKNAESKANAAPIKKVNKKKDAQQSGATQKIPKDKPIPVTEGSQKKDTSEEEDKSKGNNRKKEKTTNDQKSKRQKIKDSKRATILTASDEKLHKGTGDEDEEEPNKVAENRSHDEKNTSDQKEDKSSDERPKEQEVQQKDERTIGENDQWSLEKDDRPSSGSSTGSDDSSLSSQSSVR